MTDVYAGQLLKADHNANHESRLDLLDPTLTAWTDFSASMTITAATTDPTLGSSTKTAKYQQQGKVVHFTGRLYVTTGGAWNVGSGTYYFLLPVTAAAVINQHTGSVFIEDASVGQRMGVCRLQDTTHLAIYYNHVAANITPLGSTGPGSAWATGDIAAWSITYEAA